MGVGLKGKEREGEEASELNKPCTAPTDLCNRHNLITDRQGMKHSKDGESITTLSINLHSLSREDVLYKYGKRQRCRIGVVLKIYSPTVRIED